jgi:hypothetical protein
MVELNELHTVSGVFTTVVTLFSHNCNEYRVEEVLVEKDAVQRSITSWYQNKRTGIISVIPTGANGRPLRLPQTPKSTGWAAGTWGEGVEPIGPRRLG